MPEIGDILEIYSSPKTVEWSIINFFLLPKRIGYLAASPKFSFGDYTCRLTVFPNGTDNLPGMMIVSVTGIGKAGIVHWELEISRIDQTVLRRVGGCKNHGSEIEMTMLIPYKEVEMGCYVRGYMYIKCTLYNEEISRGKHIKIYKETSLQTEGTSRIDKLSTDLEALFLSEDDSNLNIRVGNQEFKAHKSIVGVRSPVFTSMFKHKMSESITGVVDIDDCDPVAFREFLRYLYSGRVEEFSPNNVFNLYKIADKYQVNELKDYCLEYIKNNLSVDIFCDAIILSVQYDEEELMDLAIKFLSENMAEIMDTEKWQNFLMENPTDSNRLLLEALRLQKENE